MKRTNISTCLAIAALAMSLAACGAANPSSGGTANPDRLNTNYDKALPVETQLVLGTLKLEGTPQAVDPAMAAELLPLYTLLQQLTASGSAAQAEIDAVLEQIQATMTADQIHAIAEMKLTQTAMADFFGSNGRFSASGTRTPGASSGDNFPGGGAEGGGPPAGLEGGAPPAGFEGGGPGGGGSGTSGNGGSGLNQNQIATLRAQRTGTPGFQGSGTPSFLINQLIQLLEKKAQSLTPTP
ncbi:MAG: hypothetical protein WBM17_09980 [Anaerolineales bacterium]